MEVVGMVDDVSLQIPVNVRLDIQEQVAKRVSRTCIVSIKQPYCHIIDWYDSFRISILLILNNISFTAICSPPCLNGGKCIRPPNTCKCLTSFTGKYFVLKSHSRQSIANRNNKTTLTDMSSSGKHRRGHQSHLRRNHKKQRKRRKWKTKEMLNKLNLLHQNSLIRSP